MEQRDPHDPNTGEARAASFSAPDPSMLSEAPLDTTGQPPAPADTANENPFSPAAAAPETALGDPVAPEATAPLEPRTEPADAPEPAAAPALDPDAVVVELLSSDRQSRGERTIARGDLSFRIVVDGAYYEQVGVRPDGVRQFAQS